MNEIVGNKDGFPVFSGPCKGCGRVNYGLSTSGPDYCGSCACGPSRDDPFGKRQIRELSERNEELFDKYMDATLALGLVTGVFPPFTDKMRERAEKLLAERLAEWTAKGHAQPDSHHPV